MIAEIVPLIFAVVDDCSVEAGVVLLAAACLNLPVMNKCQSESV